MAQKQQTFAMRGGLDLISPPLNVPPGFMIGGLNYEPREGGYRRRDGYERFDGQSKPHEAQYWLLNFDAGSTEIAVGDELVGETSEASSRVATVTVTSGTWGGGDAAGYVIIDELSGNYQDNEDLSVSAVVVAVADGIEEFSSGGTTAIIDARQQAAIEARRDLIAKPTDGGASGGILGIVGRSDGTTYCFRAGGDSSADMFKATSAGWVEQSRGSTIDFTAGAVAELQEGETITGGTSGATAVVRRIITQSGAWSGTAAGYLVVDTIVGNFTAAETATGGTSSGTISVTADAEAIDLPTTGRYRGVSHNFFAQSGSEGIYFTTETGRAFEWREDILTPIRTGVSESLDVPKFIGVHYNHLLLGYDGGSILYSGTGLPLSWSTTDGAGEFAIGDDITGISQATNRSTVITCRDRIAYMTGTDSTDFSVEIISENSGAVADSLAIVDQPYFVDDRGVRGLSTTDKFGDWTIGTITKLVAPWFDARRAASATLIGAYRVRKQDQLRLIYSDGHGLTIYFGRSAPECSTYKFPFTPTCVAVANQANGDEAIFAGDSDGWVYEIDAGSSDDGAEVVAWLRTPFMHQGYPNIEKRYHRAMLDITDGSGSISIGHVVDFDYGNADSRNEATETVYGTGGFYDTAYWNQFYWSAPIQAQLIAPMDGIGRNVSIVLISEQTYEAPHAISSMTINFSPRRQHR